MNTSNNIAMDSKHKAFSDVNEFRSNAQFFFIKNILFLS